MKLLLHAGPMKTGSTAFQELMACNGHLLKANGIRFRWLQRVELDQLETVIHEESKQGWPDLLLLSHECLCRQEPGRLRSALSAVSVKPLAVLVARPLREIYPSLYLQNLKGHVMRTSSYEEFLEEQIERDLRPELASRGQVFSYSFLDAQLRLAGCDVRWVRYSRVRLFRDLLGVVAQESLVPLNHEDFGSLSAPRGISPRRSLDGSVSDVVRCLNRHCHAGTVADSARQELLESLLDHSDRIRRQRQGLDPFSRKHDLELEALDDEINGEFWR